MSTNEVSGDGYPFPMKPVAFTGSGGYSLPQDEPKPSDSDPIEGERFDRPAALAGPETAAEHVRNAMQLLDNVSAAVSAVDEGRARPTDVLRFAADQQSAARARLARALAALEGPGEPRSGAPRESSDHA